MKITTDTNRAGLQRLVEVGVVSLATVAFGGAARADENQAAAQGNVSTAASEEFSEARISSKDGQGPSFCAQLAGKVASGAAGGIVAGGITGLVGIMFREISNRRNNDA